MNNIVYLSGVGSKMNGAVNKGLNEVKSVWQGSAVPVIMLVLVIALVVGIVMAIGANRNGESPLKAIVGIIIIFIIMAVVAASGGWF